MNGRPYMEKANSFEQIVAMNWTYYLDDYGDKEAWVLFRSTPNHEDEIFRRNGIWHPTRLLYERRHKGDISLIDLISEAEAEALIASLGVASSRADAR